MKKLFTILLSAAAFVGCSYDDDDLWDAIDDLDSRLTKLETAAQSANSDIAALQTLVTSLQNQVTVSSVVPTADGYVITFSNGEEATITSGKDGTNAPAISIKKDTDGIYYWTLDGNWLLVDGEKVQAQGTDGQKGEDGQDAVVPEIRLNTDSEPWQWQISTDGGATWVTMGPASTDDSGDYLFSDVDVQDDCVVITLSDGTEIELPLTAGLSFIIDTAGEETISIVCGGTRSFSVTESGVADYTISKPDGWKVSYSEGSLDITAPVAENTYADREGEIAFHLVGKTGFSAIVKMRVKAFELRILTFEDDDYKGTEGSAYWTSLIDNPQYGGPLLYGNYQSVDYNWLDADNTFLASEFPLNWNSKVYWGGGHAISNYVETDLSNGDHFHQLAVYYKDPVTGYGGHNGSKNFCMQYGYRDNSGYSAQNLPFFYFGDGEARVVDHMYVTCNTYLINCVINGNSLTEPVGEGGYVKIVAIGYDENGDEIQGVRPEFELANDQGVVGDWRKWDLSALGKVLMIEFNVEGSSDNGYGFSQPAYFAYDDVAVRF